MSRLRTANTVARSTDPYLKIEKLLLVVAVPRQRRSAPKTSAPRRRRRVLERRHDDGEDDDRRAERAAREGRLAAARHGRTAGRAPSTCQGPEQRRDVGVEGAIHRPGPLLKRAAGDVQM